MSEWNFIIINENAKDKEIHVGTVGMDFEEALAKTVKIMVRKGQPWGQSDVAEIYMADVRTGEQGRRPLMTFMAPLMSDIDVETG